MRKIWTPKIILPPILEEDERLKASATALEGALSDLSFAALECLFLPRLDILPSDILNVLANQYHVDFYDVDMSDEEKRSLIRDAIQWHRRKGTPAAVEEIARKVYADAHVTEWFEYGGEPYHFRILQDITADDALTDRDTLNRLRAAVTESKNTRSWIDFYGFLLTLEEQIEPVDTIRLNFNQYYIDEYDYRRNNDRYDGAIDYGSARWKHNGRYVRNGSFTRRGYISRGRHGRLQATDFERLHFDINMPTTEQFDLGDRVEMDFKFAAIARDTVEPADLNLYRLAHQYKEMFPAPAEYQTYAINHQYIDTVRADERNPILIFSANDDYVSTDDRSEKWRAVHILRDQEDVEEHQSIHMRAPIAETVEHNEDHLANVRRVDIDGFNPTDSFYIKNIHLLDDPVTVDEHFAINRTALTLVDNTDAPDEQGAFLLRQKITRNGHLRRNGSVTHCGSLQSKQSFLSAEEQAAWDQLRWHLSGTFDAPCRQCGRRDYTFKYGSARIGTDYFLINDPQILSVDIYCAHCGAFLQQFLVNDKEALL